MARPLSLAAVVEDEEMGQVLQFQGDQRDAVGKFLVDNGAPPAHHTPDSLARLRGRVGGWLCASANECWR